MFKAKQLDKLVKAQIITEQQKAQILAFEDAKSKGFVGRLITLLAVLSIGVGVISIIASNWENINDTFKLIVMFGLLICAGGLSFYWQEKGKTEVAESMLAGLFMLIGAAIGLIIQVFQLSGGEWYSVLFIWGVLGAPLLFAAKKQYVACFWTPVFLLWCGTYLHDMLRPQGFGAILNPFGDYMLYQIALFGALAFIGKMIALYVPQVSFGDVWRRYSLWAAYFCLALYIIFAWRSTHLYRLFIAAVILTVSGVIYKHYGAYKLIRRNVKFGALIVLMLYFNLAASLGLWQTGFGLILTGIGLLLLLKYLPKFINRLIGEQKNA